MMWVTGGGDMGSRRAVSRSLCSHCEHCSIGLCWSWHSSLKKELRNSLDNRNGRIQILDSLISVE